MNENGFPERVVVLCHHTLLKWSDNETKRVAVWQRYSSVQVSCPKILFTEWTTSPPTQHVYHLPRYRPQHLQFLGEVILYVEFRNRGVWTNHFFWITYPLQKGPTVTVGYLSPSIPLSMSTFLPLVVWPGWIPPNGHPFPQVESLHMIHNKQKNFYTPKGWLHRLQTSS